MTSKQESRFSMFLVVRDFLKANQVITDTLPNCAGYIHDVNTGIDQIQLIREQQEFDKTGIAMDKTQLKSSLIAQAVDIARRIVAYATLTDNYELRNEVNYTESTLKQSADTILKDRCQVIHDRAKQNIAALGTYGVTDGMLMSMMNTMNNYNSAIPKPRLGIADRKLATTQIASMIEIVNDNLRKIDILVEIVKTSQQNFYNEYRTARKIVNTGIGTLAARGRVTDADSGTALQGATVRWTNEINSNVIIKKTAEKGGFNMKSLAEGSYIVTVSRPGYNEYVVTVNITSGVLSVVDIQLLKK